MQRNNRIEVVKAPGGNPSSSNSFFVFLRDNEPIIVNSWVDKAALCPGYIDRAELIEQCSTLLRLIFAAWEDPSGKAWRQVCCKVEEIAEDHALLGFPPSQSAAYLLSLKKSLAQAAANSPLRNCNELSECFLKLDDLCLVSIEAFQRVREDVLAMQQQAMLEQSADEAKRAIAIREDMLAIVSHDLKNPLTAILVSAILLLEKLSKDDPLYKRTFKLVDSIKTSAERMNALIGDLLDMVKIEAGHLTVEPQVHPLAKLWQDSLDLLEPLARSKGIELVTSPIPAEICVACDKERVLQVMSNLAGNAIKFTPSGQAVFFGSEISETEILFSIRDTGPGIPPNQLELVFERYWQAKETAYTGTGLGLFIAKAIVQIHGGRIWAESELGRGSTFFFTLPLSQTPAHA